MVHFRKKYSECKIKTKHRTRNYQIIKGLWRENNE